MSTGLPRLSEEEITTRLAQLNNGWLRDGDKLVKEFEFRNFTEAAAFIGRIAGPADEMDHHPDVLLHRYRRVKIMLWTHSRGGLTQNDFDLAARIDAVAR
ncbi:MAG: 4a-hydroxytetrahydrobiopterin dehydratase [Verrucomicrobiae bacterium]|nr:4a-hydroxytetrahydrobiopterin dehydratase [Verrucomicrobiae bacterium]